MFKCVWRCYKFMKYMNSAEERSGSKGLQKVSQRRGVRSSPAVCCVIWGKPLPLPGDARRLRRYPVPEAGVYSPE